MADNRIIKLSDGRNLSFFEFGDMKGRPVFYFHGSGISTGAYPENLGSIAAENGIRLIAPDRPGIGASDFKPDRRLLDWPKDIKELADALGIRRFSIISESGGSAYAYACAYSTPERINQIAVVSGLCPLFIKSLQKGLPLKNRLALSVLKASPERLLTKMFAGLKNDAQSDTGAFFSKAAKRASDADRKMFSNADFRNCYKDSILNAFNQGYKGVINDMRILAGEWGFDVKDISCKVALWHGEKDMSAPVMMTKRIQNMLRDCTAAYFPDESHMSVMQLHAGEILGAV